MVTNLELSSSQGLYVDHGCAALRVATNAPRGVILCDWVRQLEPAVQPCQY